MAELIGSGIDFSPAKTWEEFEQQEVRELPKRVKRASKGTTLALVGLVTIWTLWSCNWNNSWDINTCETRDEVETIYKQNMDHTSLKGEKTKKVVKNNNKVEKDTVKLWNTQNELNKEIIVEDTTEINTNQILSRQISDYRESWKRNIIDITHENKEKIIKAIEEIPHTVEVDEEWSVTTTITVWNKTYKILNVNLKNHSDEKYLSTGAPSFTKFNRYSVSEAGMLWNDPNEWKNKKLAEYIKTQNEQWFYMPNLSEIKMLLRDLGETQNLSNEEDQVALLMYLTWMEWDYWLAEWYNDYHYTWSRSWLACYNDIFWRGLVIYKSGIWGLFLIASN